MIKWRGYTISYSFLLFQSCMAMRISIVLTGCGIMNDTFRIDVPRVNPKECLQKCNKTAVGIKNDHCQCGHFSPAPTPNYNCEKRCEWKETGLDFSCGGNHYSVYSRSNENGAIIDEATKSDQSGCVLMKSEHEFRVEDCSRKYPCMCEGDPFKLSGTTGTEHTWTQCAESCKAINMFGFNEAKQHCLYACNMERWISTFIYNDCSPNPCRNNGTCTNTDYSFNCSCPYGFKGNICEEVTPTQTGKTSPPSFVVVSLTATDSAIIPTVASRPCGHTVMSSSIRESFSLGSIGITRTASILSNPTHTTYSAGLSSASALISNSYAAALTQSEHTDLSRSIRESSLMRVNGMSPTASVVFNPTHATNSPGPSSASVLTSALNAGASPATDATYVSNSSTYLSSVRSTGITPTAVSTPTGSIYMSSSIKASSTVTSTAATPSVTSNQSDAVVGWMSDHAVMLFSIGGTVVILLAVIIVIICVRMRKMKLKNNELFLEIPDTPSDSEFDFKTSFSHNQTPDYVYPSYKSGQFSHNEVSMRGPPQQTFLPRVHLKSSNSFPRHNRSYEDNAY